MNPFIQGESSSGPLVPPEKRRRSHPRKDPNLKGIDETECVVGRTVAGFVEASFDDGYLLAVRIDNSATSLRGVVFKPGHLSPVTAENDIAPHLEMIRRDDVYFPAEKRGLSRRRKLGITKPRNATPQPTACAHPFDPSQTPQGDKDVHHVEPLSVFPPDQAIGQRFLGPISNQVHQGSHQNANMHVNEDTSNAVVGEKAESTESTDADDLMSSETWEDESKSSGDDDDSGNEANEDTSNSGVAFPAEHAPVSNSPSNPLFSYGTGRMTQLLQAVQEDIKDKQMQISEPQMPSSSNLDFKGLGTSASHPNT